MSVAEAETIVASVKACSSCAAPTFHDEEGLCHLCMGVRLRGEELLASAARKAEKYPDDYTRRVLNNAAACAELGVELES